MADNTPDPATGLTPKQKKAVKDSWDQLSRTPSAFYPVGQELFMRMFKQFPAIKAFFKQFDDMESDEIRESTTLKAHIVNFKHSVTSYVDNLDDVDVLVILLRKLASNHHRRNVPAGLFKDALATYIQLLKDSDIDAFTVDSWQATTDVIIKVVTDSITEIQHMANFGISA